MGTHPIFESDFDCLTEKIMLIPELLKKPAKWDKELFRTYKLMLDYNFSYLQETINAFKMRKAGSLEDAQKYESKARKCRRKYDELIEQLKTMLECETTTTSDEKKQKSAKLKTGRGRVKRGYPNVGNREPVQSDFEKKLQNDQGKIVRLFLTVEIFNKDFFFEFS